MRVLLSWILMAKMGQLFMQMDILMEKVMSLLKKPKTKCMRMKTLVFYAEGSWWGQGQKRYAWLGNDYNWLSVVIYFPTILLLLTVNYILNWYTAKTAFLHLSFFIKRFWSTSESRKLFTWQNLIFDPRLSYSNVDQRRIFDTKENGTILHV